MNTVKTIKLVNETAMRGYRPNINVIKCDGYEIPECCDDEVFTDDRYITYNDYIWRIPWNYTVISCERVYYLPGSDIPLVDILVAI